MSAPILPLPVVPASITALAHEALAAAHATELSDEIGMIQSQVRLTATVEMLLAWIEERAA
ncbi:hypothetical protein HYE82_18790 [Streptomyces sp. BR123]|uniref:hypothetical protein n=1 Tax=Streptomyces sp. BR123 TaxID=2749828 RepID=UPI0015C43298|nr:hypothetical protein [Streptomyces sp. BR123]NXY96400.1 hypothetical protein [Streptomyces sp. BR123]